MRRFAVFKPCLPCQLKGVKGRCVITVISIIAVITEQLESTFFVNTGVRYKVVAVYRFKVERVRPVLDTWKSMIAQFLTELFNISNIVSVGNPGYNEDRVLDFKRIMVTDSAKLPNLLRVRFRHFAFDLDIKIFWASSITAVEQKIREIELTVRECESLRLIFPFHSAGVKENRPSCFQP